MNFPCQIIEQEDAFDGLVWANHTTYCINMTIFKGNLQYLVQLSIYVTDALSIVDMGADTHVLEDCWLPLLDTDKCTIRANITDFDAKAERKCDLSKYEHVQLRQKRGLEGISCRGKVMELEILHPNICC